MIKLGANFFISYWRELAIGVIIGALVFVIFSWWGQTAEIARLKTQLTMGEQINNGLKERISVYEKAEEQSKLAIENADKNRQQIVAVLQKEINKIRTQVIPKDCQGAVNYGIQYKDDLKWPERSSQ